MLRWTKILKNLSWEAVRPWVNQFGTFLSIVELTEGQAKVLLLQHVDGPVLAFIEAISDNTVLNCLNQLLQYVRPSGAYVMRKLFQVKKGSRESVAAFVIRFRAASLESGVAKEISKRHSLMLLFDNGNYRQER